MEQSSNALLAELKSVLRLPESKIERTVSNGNKYFLILKNNPQGHYGGYSQYFENLSKGRYRKGPYDHQEGGGGPRTLNFLIKYISIVEKILSQSQQKPLRILDLGCSSGFLRKILEANVFSFQDLYYYGIDIRKDALKKAVESEGDNIPSLYLNYDLRAPLPFQDNVFDFVVSFEAIKYLKKKEALNLFKEINRVLKPAKIFIYSTAGVFNSKAQKEIVLKFKDKMASFWEFKELRRAMKKNNLFLMKTYGSEIYYNGLEPYFNLTDQLTLIKMESLYPKELIAAIFCPFYPDATITKLFFISKGRVSLLKEVEKMFPENKVIRLKHRGNSKIFCCNDKIIKYIPKNLFEKYFKIYRLLKEQTEIELPEIIQITESEISENYIVVMEKTEGDLLGDLWKKSSEEKKEIIIHKIVSLLKQIHSIHLNPSGPSLNCGLIKEAVSWKEEVNQFCLAKLNQAKEKKIIGKGFYNNLLSILNQNINYLSLPESDYKLLGFDLNSNNLIVGKDLNLTLLFDFETFIVGDKYLDLVIIGSLFEKKYEELLFNLYGIPDNFDKISKVYRLLLILHFLRKIKRRKEEKVEEFIKRGGRFPLFLENETA